MSYFKIIFVQLKFNKDIITLGDGKILRIAYCLENCIGTGDWQCRYIRGRCSYICRIKRGRITRVLWRETLATTESIKLQASTKRGRYNRVQPYLLHEVCTSAWHARNVTTCRRGPRSLFCVFIDTLPVARNKVTFAYWTESCRMMTVSDLRNALQQNLSI